VSELRWAVRRVHLRRVARVGPGLGEAADDVVRRIPTGPGAGGQVDPAGTRAGARGDDLPRARSRWDRGLSGGVRVARPWLHRRAAPDAAARRRAALRHAGELRVEH